MAPGPLVGRSVSHYRIVARLGGGASLMGLRSCAAELTEKPIVASTSPKKNDALRFMRHTYGQRLHVARFRSAKCLQRA